MLSSLKEQQCGARNGHMARRSSGQSHGKGILHPLARSAVIKEPIASFREHLHVARHPGWPARSSVVPTCHRDQTPQAKTMRPVKLATRQATLMIINPWVELKVPTQIGIEMFIMSFWRSVSDYLLSLQVEISDLSGQKRRATYKHVTLVYSQGRRCL